MVTMFVGKQDGGYLCGFEADGIEALEGFFRAETGVDQDGGVIGPEHCRIAAAAAAEHDEFHAAQRSGGHGPVQMRFVFGHGQAGSG